MTYDAESGTYRGQLGPFDGLPDGRVTITVHASDPAGNNAPSVDAATLSTSPLCPVP
jgi:hypothetical protein